VATSLNIIVVEDHDTLRQVTVALLEACGHQVLGVASAEALDDEVGGRVADIFLLDLNLPGEDGISLTKRLRHAHPQAGIIMVTARNQPQDVVTGYDSGADIYLTKPVGQSELMAAVQSLGRRVKPGLVQPTQPMALDVQRLRLTGPLASSSLTAVDVTLLSALARAPGQRLAYWQLHEALGEIPNESNKANLEVRMARLRKRMAQASGEPAAIKAIRGRGYQLCSSLALI
jgi:DNA-binding response OmpR family regulator